MALCQMNPAVGDLDGNVDRIVGMLASAEEAGADLAVFPELAVTGYPPEDLLCKPAFVADNVAALHRVAEASEQCAAVVGFVDLVEPGGGRDLPRGAGIESAAEVAGSRPLRNAAALCSGGRVRGVYHKRLLPNYGVFDEQRWFAPGASSGPLFEVAGSLVGITICEDVWFAHGPVADQAAAGARLVVVLNASPYSMGRRFDRLGVIRDRAHESGCAIGYVNQVGGQDELVFDGASLVVDSSGDLLAGGAQFAEDLVIVDMDLGGLPASQPAERVQPAEIVCVSDASRVAPSEPLRRPRPPDLLGEEAEVYAALVLGTRDYLAKNGFSDAVIGLSGGVDSALVAAIATDALGAGHTHAVSMPSRYSSEGSRSDAALLAGNLGIELSTVPIEAAHTTFARLLDPVLGGPPAGLADENLQSRIRGVVLMTISNSKGWIVLTTGNKSEVATGYSTLYGDSAGGFAVIRDVPKTLVYRLCRYRNARAGHAVIPESILTKAPSAELRPDQRDDQALPPYDVLDPVLQALVEEDRPVEDLVLAGFDPAVVRRVAGLVDAAEYKRRQSPPGVRITHRAFGKDRRMPLTNRYRERISDSGQPSADGEPTQVVGSGEPT